MRVVTLVVEYDTSDDVSLGRASTNNEHFPSLQIGEPGGLRNLIALRDSETVNRCRQLDGYNVLE